MDFIMIRYVVSNVQKEDRYKSQMRTQLAPKQTKYRLSVYRMLCIAETTLTKRHTTTLLSMSCTVLLYIQRYEL